MRSRCSNEDHYGLDKVKERIVEYLAVQQRVQKLKGPILCLVGPPGVGKTSLGQSIARATNRKFVRMSLGGVRDEAEIRGHRRTYIGSMPGKIMQNMAQAGVRNPLFLLDEVDKMSMDFRGDPSSALLEVLDPEQNSTFNDHYLEVDFDLSEVMFVCTANTPEHSGAAARPDGSHPPPGLHRGREGQHCATLPVARSRSRTNGLRKTSSRSRPSAPCSTSSVTTRARRVCATWSARCRRSAARCVKELLLEARHASRSPSRRRTWRSISACSASAYGRAEETNQVGQVTGLAWTEVGGELLTIEAAVMPGKGKLTHTGQLGEVMQESIQAAMTVVRSRANVLGHRARVLPEADVHIHVPEGATPKDGPSAGVGMCTALVSALTRIPVRSDVAMTGEITLRGEVLPIGGLKEKLLAAHRGGIRTVLIPDENVKDLAEIPDNIKGRLEIKPVKWIDEVLQLALRNMPQPTATPEVGAATETKRTKRPGRRPGKQVHAH